MEGTREGIAAYPNAPRSGSPIASGSPPQPNSPCSGRLCPSSSTLPASPLRGALLPFCTSAATGAATWINGATSPLVEPCGGGRISPICVLQIGLGNPGEGYRPP